MDASLIMIQRCIPGGTCQPSTTSYLLFTLDDKSIFIHPKHPHPPTQVLWQVDISRLRNPRLIRPVTANWDMRKGKSAGNQAPAGGQGDVLLYSPTLT